MKMGRNKLLILIYFSLAGLIYVPSAFARLSESNLNKIDKILTKFRENCTHWIVAHKKECNSKAEKLKTKLEKIQIEISQNAAHSSESSDVCPSLNGVSGALTDRLLIEDSRNAIRSAFPQGELSQSKVEDRKSKLIKKAGQILNSEGSKLVNDWSERIAKTSVSLSTSSSQRNLTPCTDNEVDMNSSLIQLQKKNIDSLKSQYHLEGREDLRQELRRKIEEANLKYEANQYLNPKLDVRKCINSKFYNDFIATILNVHGGPVSMTFDDAYTLLKTIRDDREKWIREAKAVSQKAIANKDVHNNAGWISGWISKDLVVFGQNNQVLEIHLEVNSAGKIRIQYQKKVKVGDNIQTSSSEISLGAGVDMRAFTVLTEEGKGLEVKVELRTRNSTRVVAPSESKIPLKVIAKSSVQVPVTETVRQDTGVPVKRADHSAPQAAVRNLRIKNTSPTTMWKNEYMIEYLEKNAKDKSGIIHAEVIKKADGQEILEEPLYDGSLDRFRSLSREEILDIYYQFAVGLKHLHDAKIEHGDVKEQNVLIGGYGKGKTIKKREAVVADFGFSTILDENNTKPGSILPIRGTPATVAPEIWQPIQPGDRNTNEQRILKRDVYGFGIELDRRLNPPPAGLPPDTPAGICAEYYHFIPMTPAYNNCYIFMAPLVYKHRLDQYLERTRGKPIKDSFEKLVIDALNPDPDGRPSAAQVVTRFENLLREEKANRSVRDETQRQDRLALHTVRLR